MANEQDSRKARTVIPIVTDCCRYCGGMMAKQMLKQCALPDGTKPMFRYYSGMLRIELNDKGEPCGLEALCTCDGFKQANPEMIEDIQELERG